MNNSTGIYDAIEIECTNGTNEECERLFQENQRPFVPSLFVQLVCITINFI